MELRQSEQDGFKWKLYQDQHKPQYSKDSPTDPPWRLVLPQKLYVHARSDVCFELKLDDKQLEIWMTKGVPGLPTVCHGCRSSNTANFLEQLLRCSYCYKAQTTFLYRTCRSSFELTFVHGRCFAVAV